VVDLAHEQAGRDVEGEVDDRSVGLGDLRAAQRLVDAPVDDVAVARREEERQEDPRRHQDDEAVEGDLAQHERPVVGKDVAQRLLDDLRRP
jgi:hypothetical protein